MSKKANKEKVGQKVKAFWNGVFGKPELQAKYMKCCSCGSRYPLLHVYGNRYVCRNCVDDHGRYWYMK